MADHLVSHPGCFLAHARTGIATAALFGFVRVSTNRRVFEEPLAVADAVGRVRRWLTQPNVTFLVPGTRYLEISFQLLERLGTAANLTTDVQLAAHAIEHGGEVHSHDTEFSRFEGLRWLDPLTA